MQVLVFNGDKQVKECPHCGGGVFYVAIFFSGKSVYHRNIVDGTEACNSELHDGCVYKEQKTAYCSDCYERIGMVRDVPAGQ